MSWLCREWNDIEKILKGEKNIENEFYLNSSSNKNLEGEVMKNSWEKQTASLYSRKNGAENP